MPSKAKKNRRRMKRARALKAAFEEQHAANPPVKASRGLAVGAPPATNQKKPVKKPAPAPTPAPSPASAAAPCQAPTPVVAKVPAKVPETIPVAVPIAKDAPKPTVPETVAETVQVQVKLPEPVLIEETPVEVEVKIPTAVSEEENVIQTQVLEPPTVEAVEELKTEQAIPEAEAVTEVSPPAEGPVDTPAETPVPAVDTTVLSKEVEQDVLTQSVEAPEVPTIIPEAPKEAVAAPVADVTELIKDSQVEDLTANEAPKAVECETVGTAAVQQETVAGTDALTVQTESMDAPPAEPEPIVAPAEEVVSDCTTDLLPEKPTSNVCDMACQMQLSVDPVQLSSVEMSMDTALNSHMAPEVPIEG